MSDRAGIDDDQRRLRLRVAICGHADVVVGQNRIPNAHVRRSEQGNDSKAAVVLEPAVFDDRIRIRVAQSGVPDTVAVVADLTVVDDQIRSSRGLVDACCDEAGNDRVLDNQSAAPAERDSECVAEHNAIHGQPSNNDLVRRRNVDSNGPGDEGHHARGSVHRQ